MTGFEPNPRKVEYVVKATVGASGILGGAPFYEDVEAVFDKLIDACGLILDIKIALVKRQNTCPIAKQYFPSRPYHRIMAVSERVIQRIITEEVVAIVKMPDRT
jgi:hypothetical protein